MKHFIFLNNHGLQRFLLKDNVDVANKGEVSDILTVNNNNYFADIKWALTDSKTNNKKKRNSKLLRAGIFGSNAVQASMEEEIEKRQQKYNSSYDKQNKIVNE